MPQDAFTIYHTAKELQKKLIGARVDKINQPSHDTIVINIRTQNKNEKLLLSANPENARVVLTETKKESPIQAPNFCMLLRKHLASAVIKNVESLPFERIFKLTFDCKNELRESGVKVIYVEVMGKYSNITLTEDGIILGAIKQSQSVEGSRPIFPGMIFLLPKSQDKIELNNKEQSLQALANFNSSDFASYIFNNFKGLSKQTATEIVYRYFNKHDVSSKDIINSKIEDFYNFFKDFYEDCNYSPCYVFLDTIKDFYIKDYLSVNIKKTPLDSILNAIDTFYQTKEDNFKFLDIKRRLTESVKAIEKKTLKKYQIAQEKILDCKNMQNHRMYGELIISNLYNIKDGQDKAVLDNYYSPDYEKITIKLDPTISAKQNAERYFKKYNKEKKTVAAVEPQILQLEDELKYIQSIYDEIDLCQSVSDFIEIEEELINAKILKSPAKSDKKKVKQGTYRIYHYMGFEIFAGKNNVQNDRLTSSAERHDIWLHAKGYHSSHVVIKTFGKEVPDEVLLYAAEICAYYSKARNSDKVPIDYTLKKYVKKPSGWPVGMVTYTNFKTILVTPNNHI